MVAFSLADVAEKREVSNKRIIVKIVFWRPCGLWNVIATKWKWSKEEYVPVFKLGLGSTNFDI